MRRQLVELSDSTRIRCRSLSEWHAFLLRLAKYENELRAIAAMGRLVAALELEHSPAANGMGSILTRRGTELEQGLSDFLLQA